MRRLYNCIQSIIILLTLLLISCNPTSEHDSVAIRGSVTNPTEDSIRILDKNHVDLVVIPIEDNNTFSITLKAEKGYYFIKHSERKDLIYLSPGFNLNSFIDGSQHQIPSKFQGNGSKENNYLAQRKSINGRLNLEEDEYLSLIDSLKRKRKEELALVAELGNEFRYIEEQKIEIDEFETLNDYAIVTIMNGKKLSINYPDKYAGIDFNNHQLLQIPDFIITIESYYRDIIGKKYVNKKSGDYQTFFLASLDSVVSNDLIKQELAYHIAFERMKFSRDRDALYSQYLLLTNNEQYIKNVKELYQKFKRTEPGQPSPSFTLNDIDGKPVSLEEFKGKLVFIDIWATWCGPCIKEIPSLKALEKKYPIDKIQFVSICKDDTYDRWKNFVIKKDLSGTQLYAPDKEIQFFKDFVGLSLPHFILLDAEGRIIDANASRPSNPRLMEQLDKLMLQ